MIDKINFNGFVANVNIVEGSENTFEQNIGDYTVPIETSKMKHHKNSLKKDYSHNLSNEPAFLKNYTDEKESLSPQTRDFFISYNNEHDGTSAAWIAQTLRENGYTVFFQADDCKPGMSFPQWMGAAIKLSENFLAVWSKAYENSLYCQDELNAAYVKSRKSTEYRFLLARVENTPIGNDLFRPFVRIDLLSDDDTNQSRLLSALEQLRHI